MRWSIRTTLLAVVLPLTAVTLLLSATRIADLVAVRNDVAGFRDSAFRAIYAERYGRHVQALLKVSFDHVSGRNERLEAVASARARMVDTLERLRSFVHEAPKGSKAASLLTPTTLAEWEATQEQFDIDLGRAFALAHKGETARARRLVTDKLEVLARSRIFSAIDSITPREQELLDAYQARVALSTGHWLANAAGAIDLREQLLPDISEAILAERFARNAYADFKSLAYYVLESRPLGASHGIAAGQAIDQLSRLQQGRGMDGGAAELADTYARVRNAYARTLALPAAARRSSGASHIRQLGEVFDQSLLPDTNAIVWAQERSIEQGMARLARFAEGTLALTIAMAAIAFLLALGSPYLASRLVVRPVIDLLDTVSSFRSGDKEARTSVRAHGELGLLGSSLNALLDELEETGRKVSALAFYDSTTGLPNRQFFQERLEKALITARLQGRTMALLTVRLAGSEQVNETLGHRAGDDLIRQVAARLRESVRLSDVVSHPSQEEWKAEVSHLGGDEFTLLLTKIRQASDASITAQRVLMKVSEPFRVEDRDIVLSTNIGIGVYPQDGGDAETLLRNSSAAMAEAKNRGGNLYQFYSEAMNVANSRKLHIQSRLGSAIERDDLTLHYQPIYHAKHGHLTGAEALLRWTDAELGPIGPDEFIPIAGQCGLSSRIGLWMLETACDQVHAWQEAGYAEIRMSVNASAHQLRDESWVETVADTLEDKAVSAGSLEFEITETSIIQDEPTAVAILTELAAMGVGIALDDFGTGYSSLAHLRRLPICRVKIDRCFVSEITESEAGAALAQGIVALAHGLQLEVVAEGVETQEQANFLRSSGCDELQGYLISRPVPAEEFERFLVRQKPE